MGSFFLYFFLIFSTYKLSKDLINKKSFCLLLIAVFLFSPLLIFRLNNIPLNLLLLSITLTILPSILKGKFFNQKDISIKIRFYIIFVIFSLSFAIFVLTFFKDKTALLSYLSIFNNIGIINGINTSRGVGIEGGWPPVMEKIFFNKSQYFFSALLNWLSFMSPANFFGLTYEQLSNKINITPLFPRIFIIPFLVGLSNLIRDDNKNRRFILYLIPLFLLPFFFTFPNLDPEKYILIYPLLCIIIAFGLLSFTQLIRILTFSVALLELTIFNTYG